MKALKLIIIFLCISFCMAAQVQQGYVKTLGKPNHPGKKLDGVIITIKTGQTVMSHTNGNFSFPISKDSTFVILSVKKKGYTLVDTDILNRRLFYSKNPIILIMETPDKIAKDKQHIERKIRRTLESQLQAKEDEIDSLRAQNKLNNEEYYKAMEQIYSDMESSQRLISEMAERYSKFDYDTINELDLRIAESIINGNLIEADSLLSQKGSISERITQINSRIDISRNDVIAMLDAKIKAAAMDLAEDCIFFYEKWSMQWEYDSAAYYLSLRSSLDTTNIKWNLDAGKFIINYLFSKQNDNIAYNYFMRALQFSLSKEEEDYDLANAYMCIGDMYFKWSNYNEAFKTYQKAFHVFEAFNANDIDACQCMERIALSYNSMKLYDKAIEQLLSTLSKYNQFHNERKDLIANCHINLGAAYENSEEYSEAFSQYEKALLILDSITDYPSLEKIAYCYNNMGSACEKQKRYDDAIKYYTLSLDIITHFKDLKFRQLDLGYLYNNIASSYYNQENYKKALDYYIKSLHFLSSRLDKNHPSIKTVQENIITTINEMVQSDSWTEIDN